MARKTSAGKKNHAVLLGLLIFVVAFQLASTDSLAQDRATTSLLTRLAAKTTSNLKVSFAYSPRFPAEGQVVQFVESSSGSPTSWMWNFGDGTTSTEKNPTHVYSTSGFRKVTLVAAAGTRTRTASRTITVMPATSNATFVFSPTTPGPSQTVQFADTTSGTPSSWQWNFGDGATSAVKNPSHAFGRAGAYTVTLVASTGSGQKQGSQVITVAAMSVLSASFTYAPSLPTTSQAIQFTDTSSGSPTSWLWNFGDGTTSATRNPSHTYATAGSKTVTLTVTNSTGSNVSTRTLTVSTALEAAFTFTPASPTAGQSVQFTDTSSGSPTSWLWNFGDGTTSAAQNPGHAYPTAGSKTVTLTVTNSTGSNVSTRTLSVSTALVAAFTFTPASPTSGQSVQFTDTSTGTPSIWQWSFGDGGTSTSRNPVHAFATAGTYTVTLTIMNSSGQNAVSRAITVTAPSTVTASFTYNPSAPTAFDTVQFTDTSTGNPTTWQWTFGDGGTSAARNPSHVYTVSGTYTASLTASSGSSSNTTSRTITIAPSPTLAASFSFSPSSPAPGQAVSFTDTSTGAPTSWQWSFGDGGSSTVQNPSHAYTAEGSYVVTLIAGGTSGSDTVSRTVTVAATSRILPEDRLYDWTLAGVPGGIINRSTIFRTLTSANTAEDINAAIAACPSGQVVYLAAGTYNIGQVTFAKKSGVTLRGAGAGRTIIIPTITSSAITNSAVEFSEAEGIAVSSGYTKGSTVITLASSPTPQFVAGNLMAVSEDAGPNKWGTGIGTYYRVGFPAGSTVYNLSQNRIFHYISRIVSVSGNRVTLATPLPLGFSSNLNIKAYAQTTDGCTSLCGLENLTIDGQNAAQQVIYFCGADRCWVMNVEIKNVASSDIGQIRLNRSFQCEIRRCYIHDCAGYPDQADGYATGFNFGTSNCLLVDNIVNRVASLNQSNGASGNAYLYNYSRDTLRASAYSKGININHGPHGFMNLVEGNVMSNFTNDGYHGSASHSVVFRNHLNGLNSEALLNPIRIVNLCRGSYFESVVGNVLGDPSWTPAYYELPASGSTVRAIYSFGFPGADSTSMSAFASVAWTNWSKSTNIPDTDVLGTLIRHGNYDYYNRGVAWDPGISSQVIPFSLYYSSKPAFFGSLQWPPIGPDVSGLVNDIPAKARWNAYLTSGNLDDLFRNF